MAVKARDATTLLRVEDGVDVASVTRYYQLAASTASAPAKPTTNPPASAWTSKEPGYDGTTASTLYFTDLTVFSDGAFSYSDVSKSSAYEAAKQAYNKADNAQAGVKAVSTLIRETADGVEVGKSADGETYAGAHVLLSGESLSFLDKDGNVLAVYEADGISLGKNSASAVIDLCDGSGILSQYKDGGINLRGEYSVIDSLSPVGIEKYGQGLALAGSKGVEGDASQPFGGEVILLAQAATQGETAPSMAKIEMRAYYGESSAVDIFGDRVTVNGAGVCSAVSLYSNSTGSTSVTLSTAITSFNYLMICIKNAQGAHHWVVAKAAAGDCPFETHGVTDGTMWVVFGTLNLAAKAVRITSQVNMPISGWVFGSGTSNIDCLIVAVRGCY